MKKFFPFVVMCLVSGQLLAAPTPRGRASMAGQMMNSQRATMSTNQISAMAMANGKYVSGNANLAVTPEVTQPAVKDTREKEKNACVGNNIGIGNTFVWASRYSNLSNYSSMIEDVEEPANNTCFVKVGLKSNDSRVDVSDVPAKYFEMGQTITCGSWANEETMRQRILDAKKGARVGGTIGAVVGGAALGVGAMELFGNKLIGGKVEGQYDESLSQEQLLRSQLIVLQKENVAEYNEFVRQLKIVKVECNALESVADQEVETICNKYEHLFDLAS